jgi:hypothetical protein
MGVRRAVPPGRSPQGSELRACSWLPTRGEGNNEVVGPTPAYRRRSPLGDAAVCHGHLTEERALAALFLWQSSLMSDFFEPVRISVEEFERALERVETAIEFHAATLSVSQTTRAESPYLPSRWVQLSTASL